MYSFKLAPAKWSLKFDIFCIFCIMSALAVFVFPKPEFFIAHSQRFIPIHSLFFPVFKPFISFFVIWFNKIFKLHLFKFAASVSEISRRYFVSKSLANLGYTKRNFNAR